MSTAFEVPMSSCQFDPGFWGNQVTQRGDYPAEIAAASVAILMVMNMCECFGKEATFLSVSPVARRTLTCDLLLLSL